MTLVPGGRQRRCLALLILLSAASVLLYGELSASNLKITGHDVLEVMKKLTNNKSISRASFSKFVSPTSSENRTTAILSRETSKHATRPVLPSAKGEKNNSKVIRVPITRNKPSTPTSLSRITRRLSPNHVVLSNTMATNSSKMSVVSGGKKHTHGSIKLPALTSKGTNNESVSETKSFKVNTSRPASKPDYIKSVYLSVKFNGRLGNLMFEFASLIGTARFHKVTPVMEPNDFLTNTFNINIPKMDSKVIAGFTHIGEKRPCAYDTLNGNFSTNITLYGYLQSWRYFKTAFSELRELFSLRDKVKERAVSSLLLSLGAQHGNISTDNLTFVGIHVRRGDFLREDNIKFGYVVASAEYLRAAMDLFVAKYGKVMFVVCSNDMDWTKSVIPHENATFIENQEAEVDMATLSLCNHTIMTSGSFGWWAGFLAGGSTVYQIEQVTPGSDLSKQFDLRDYMLPDWIGISITGNTSRTRNTSKTTAVSDSKNHHLVATKFPVLTHKGTKYVSVGNAQPVSVNISHSLYKPAYIKPVYLSVKFIGRLGNLMFEFASLIGTARLHKVTPVMEPNDLLTNTFNINILKMDSKVITGFTHIGEKRPCAYDTLNGNFSTNITLYGYLQSWLYFKTAFSELRELFSFRDKVKERAVSSLLLSLGAQHGNISTDNLTFVGIHVRRGDFLREDKIKFGYVVASAEYLRAAMDLFVAKYGKVMFVVCSNGMDWTKGVIPRENATFIENQEAEVDMATLSLCNHTIMTSGSFGWWAGFLAGGSTVYQIEQVTPGSDLSKQFDLRDYMLPEWIGISKSGNISNVNM